MQYAVLSSWALVVAAADEDRVALAEFARRYDQFVRRVLAKRWLSSPCRRYFDDAVNAVFVECIKPYGVIQKAQSSKGVSFRSLLYRVVCHVAARFERDHVRDARVVCDSANLAELTESDHNLLEQLTREEVSDAIRRSLAMMTESEDDATRRRGELLRQHTCEDLKIIHLASGDPQVAEALHREHSKAKKEFTQILFSVIQVNYDTDPDDLRVIINELFSVFR